MDESAGSVSRWIIDLKAGDTQALQPLWDRYYATLVERARAKLRTLHSSTALNDEEDLALSAFQSLFQGVREGRFPRLEDRDDLWRLLVHLTACKAVDQHRPENRQKRGGGKIVNEADMIAPWLTTRAMGTRSTGSSAPSRARSSPRWWPRSTSAGSMNWRTKPCAGSPN